MAIVKYLSNNFSSGKVGSLVKRRGDTTLVSNGLEECENMLPMPQGGLKSRPGTLFVDNSFTDTAATLKSFQYTTNDSVIGVVQGIDSLRVDYYNESGFVDTETGYWSSARIPNLYFSQNADNLYVVHPLVKPYTRTGTTNFAAVTFVDGPYLDINTTATTITPSATSGTITFTASAVTGINNDTGFQTTDVGRQFRFFDRGIVFDITAITAAAVGVLTITQSGLEVNDYIYITSVGGMTELNNADRPYIVASLTNNYSAGVYVNTKITLKDSETGQLINTSGYTTYTSSGYIQKIAAGTWHSITIASRVSTTVVTGTITTSVEDEIQLRTTKALSSLIPQAQWRLGAWSDTTGFPKTVHFVGQRAIYGGNTVKPQTIWASRIGDPTNMSPTTLPDAALVREVAGGVYNGINWLAGDQFLRVGGDGAINLLDLGLDKAYKEIIEKTAAKGAIDLGTSTVFISKDGKSLRLAEYKGDSTRLQATDLNIHNDEIFNGSTIKKVVLQNQNGKVIWAVTAAGDLCSLTLDPDAKVLAWASHTIGGANSIQDIEVSTQDGLDRLWLLVNRTINGGTELHLEKLSFDFRDTDIEDAVFMDAALIFSSTSNPTGLDHLEGETVKVFGDGTILSDAVVTSGAITLDATYTDVIVGLEYARNVETLPLSAGGALDTTMDSRAKINKCYINVFETSDFLFGYSSTTLNTYTSRLGNYVPGDPLPLFTGTVEQLCPSGWSDKFKMYLQGVPCLPFTVVSITTKGEINA